MSINDEELDMYIKERIARELEQIPVPAVDEEWLKFKSRVINEKISYHIIPNILVAVVAVIIIISGSLTLFRPAAANAFGERLIQMFNHIVGKTTQNKTQTISNNSSGTNTPMVKDLGNNVDKEISLEEAQKSAYFKIAEPKYLPSGTTTQKVSVINLSADIKKITIEYTFQGKLFILTQQNTSGTLSQGLLYDTDDTVAKDIMINGVPATLMTEKNGMNVLTWHQRGLSLQLTGQLTAEEFLKIAQSII
ncbi:MAG: DUF4367 domain-containing protein [Desulfitobacteriaceae bacterium]